ncbi:MAG: leucyl aminopeptidase family protein [Phenylobacterium sp.]|uniref:leucyl aminopeptidase family protein n=1 Tax=Phenylobacterium sp. TaxID=1871053 RepID=UPI0025FDF239|nr:leucyl aminopeptidase family protein [Phenylobacterium sp.]MCA3739671.1 leucyl aminopeptidase family protein [Phenylobacterium sp.]MCA6245909.1 leucyl aminopeptidase family protein [Phenylobacterium sp.]
MPVTVTPEAGATPVPVVALREEDLSAWREGASPLEQGLAGPEFRARPGQMVVVPGPDGKPARVLLGLGASPGEATAFRTLAGRLPPGDFRLEGKPGDMEPTEAALAFALGLYRFERYRRRDAAPPRLVTPGADEAQVANLAGACALAKDLINTPANDLGPAELEGAARELAGRFGAQIEVITGDELLTKGYPAVHAVGRAAAPGREPRMIEITWGEAGRPGVALVGKGVVFDTGGLDLKPSAGMRLMKKDMGGAAHVLALGAMVMEACLPVRLSVLIPAVENAVSGDAMRPGDVLATRKGLSVEVGNTDAEGRLILADALTRASELSPDLTLDLATLTGAARVALGPQLPPFFTDDEDLAAAIEAGARKASDPVWRLPLWKGYLASLETEIADLKNDPDAWAQAGAMTAALFLQKFAPAGAWAHFDIFAWNPRAQPGYPVGGEAQAILGLFAMLKARYA